MRSGNRCLVMGLPAGGIVDANTEYKRIPMGWSRTNPRTLGLQDLIRRAGPPTHFGPVYGAEYQLSPTHDISSHSPANRSLRFEAGRSRRSAATMGMRGVTGFPLTTDTPAPARTVPAVAHVKVATSPASTIRRSRVSSVASRTRAVATRILSAGSRWNDLGKPATSAATAGEIVCLRTSGGATALSSQSRNGMASRIRPKLCSVATSQREMSDT